MGVRKLWKKLRRWWSVGALPLALACGGDATAPASHVDRGPDGVPPPVVHAPPLPLPLDVIDGRFGAPLDAADVSLDAGGGVWVASAGGLDVRPPGKAFFSHVSMARPVTTVGGLGAGTALVGHDAGPMSIVRVGADGSAVIDAVDVEGFVHDIRPIEAGTRALVAGATGLAVVEGDGTVTALRAADPPNEELWSVASAADGAVWFVTFEQLRRIRGSAPGDLSGPVDLELDLVDGEPDHSVAVDACANGDVWVATLGHGVFRLSGSGSVLAHLDASRVLPQDHVISVACEPAGGVWLGTSWGGLLRLHPDGAADYHTRDAGLPGDSIRTILPVAEVAGRALWIATEGGVAVYRGR